MIETVLQALYEKDGPVHCQTLSDIVSAMHDVQVKLEREVLLLRAEKRLAARPTDHKPSNVCKCPFLLSSPKRSFPAFQASNSSLRFPARDFFLFGVAKFVRLPFSRDQTCEHHLKVSAFARLSDCFLNSKNSSPRVHSQDQEIHRELRRQSLHLQRACGRHLQAGRGGNCTRRKRD